jgi:hypothetical protein
MSWQHLYQVDLRSQVCLVGWAVIVQQFSCTCASVCHTSRPALTLCSSAATLQHLGTVHLLRATQVRRAQQLLTCYRAVAALRSDESFQEDASEPAVQAALHEMALANSFEK